MCGIAGIWRSDSLKKEDESLIVRMTESMTHRGPDSNGVYLGKNLAMGHRRLSIIDLDERSNQPFSDPDKKYTLVFNGEIYNYLELKQELQSKFKVDFLTTSDTEVLLFGLVHEGIYFLERLNGFFAFAFANNQTGELLIARDRYGIKPLYYSLEDDRILFASELRAVIKSKRSPEIDRRSLLSYLQLSYIPAPHTILQGVRKLIPGSYLMINNDGVKEVKYYSIKVPDQYQDLGETGKFRDKLSQAVDLRLRADVPVGTFLSGGIDSSVITLLASKKRDGISAFSVGFPDQPYYDESPYAAYLAKKLKVDHHVLNLTESDIDSKVHRILRSIDEPFADSSAILVNLISGYAREHVKVVLSGDGADEIMGGYNKHRALLRSLDKNFVNFFLKSGTHALSLFPESRSKDSLNKIRKLKRYSQGLKLPLRERYEAWASFTQKNLCSRLVTANESPHQLDLEIDTEDFNSILKTDVELVLSNDMLHKVDLMSMNNGLEARVPFLDHNLVDYLFSIPASEKIDKKSGKNILRKTFENDFEPGFFKRKKKGFEAPLVHWLAGPLKDLRKDLFDKDLIEKQGFLNYEEVKRIEKKCLSQNPGDTPHTIWALLVFQFWYLENIGD